MKGITLIELIVAMVIVGIMLGGVLSANYAILRMDQTGSRKAALFMRAQGIVDQIKNDAVKLNGRSGTALTGYYRFGNGSNLDDYLCFYVPSGSGKDYICYTLANDGLTSSGSTLFRCLLDSEKSCKNDPSSVPLGVVASDFFSAVLGTNGFRMKVSVNDMTINYAVTLDVVAYPEGLSF